MRILICSVVDLERSSNNRLHYFIRALASDHQITVLSVTDWWKAKHQGQDAFQADADKFIKGVKIIPISNKRITPVWQELGALFSNSSRFRTLVKQADLVINYNSIIVGARIAQECHRFQVPLITDIADDLIELIRESPQIPTPILRNVGAWVGQIALRRSLRESKMITYASAVLQKQFSKGVTGKQALIPNGVDLTTFSSAILPPDIQRTLTNYSGRTIGYVGALREWVNLPMVIDAVHQANLQGQHLRLVVVGSEGRFEEFQSYTKKHASPGEVIFLGARAYSEVPGIMKLFDIGIIPFVQTPLTMASLPLKLFEYAASGISIISTSLPEVQRIAGQEIMYANSTEEYIKRMIDYHVSCPRYTFLQQYDWNAIGNQVRDMILQQTKS